MIVYESLYSFVIRLSSLSKILRGEGMLLDVFGSSEFSGTRKLKKKVLHDKIVTNQLGIALKFSLL